VIKHPEEGLGLVVPRQILTNSPNMATYLGRQCCCIQAQFPVHIRLAVAVVFNQTNTPSSNDRAVDNTV
jgi:hypothetical protein